ncbi:aspartate kinase [Streptoalloteichus tenebrarius]|uniref:Aspartokinase n=1 Tax=Streptoalloteichus tenebrarius (strain ATCC 17920 / DSM 40477 / JCM 4838 / CBS 697.72 / NBRC 16177 / NCIMB 11028 / NRRL B-12390 / A12253. 1 / ISP 5477) TaxID=1933 RepID=A0ABT1I1N2_STRSD|nr:aspartate kinase [Streptoalloteichus tenebrarius]MCP2261669.1 aspartate kinase [Streptoalloteichus tenebrarius]
MSLLVQKFGGTSVGDAARVRAVARRVHDSRAAGHDVVVVVSAMGSTTDKLVALAQELSTAPASPHHDLLLSTGEVASTAALALALAELGVAARPLSGPEAGILTDGVHGRARIVHVDPAPLTRSLGEGVVPVVAGFQGAATATGALTTLARGGSDTTAVALAAALGADACEIYTDVDGVFTSDPRHVAHAHKLDAIGYEDMAEMVAGGARVLAQSAVEHAAAHRVPVHVRSSALPSPGTWVGNSPAGAVDAPHRPVVGLAHQAGQWRCRVADVGDEALPAVFGALTRTSVPLDLVRVDADSTLSFTVHADDRAEVRAALAELRTRGDLPGDEWSGPFGKVSLVGRGIGRHPDVLPGALAALRAGGITVQGVAIHPRRLALLCQESDLMPAVLALHEAFLEQESEPARAWASLPGTSGWLEANDPALDDELDSDGVRNPA